jgi:Flp pilus assembly protein TadD
MPDCTGGSRTDQAKTESSKNPRDVLTRAAALYRAGQRHDALAQLRGLVAVPFAPAEALAIAAKLATELGDLDEALHYYRKAAEATPNLAELHYNVGLILARLGRNDEAVAAYRRATGLRPDLLPAQNNLAVVLQAMGRWEEAVEAYRRALALAPSAELYRNLGIALAGAGRRDDAVNLYRQAIALRPDWPAPFQSLANTLLELGDAQGAVEACDAWLALRPGLPEPIGLAAVALDELGCRDAARRLVDLDRFLRVVRVEAPPPGYGSLEAFHAALARETLAHPTLRTPDEREPHYNGPAFKTTRELFGQSSGPFAALESMFAERLADYLATEGRGDQSHPFLARPMPRLRPSAVATVLTRQGRLAPHMHYAGYVSGVYYCQLPAVIAAAGGQEGWFEIGRPPPRLLRRGAPEVRTIRPEEGMMLLFPSYFFHGTLPFAAETTRISIAFDTIPLP